MYINPSTSVLSGYNDNLAWSFSRKSIRSGPEATSTDENGRLAFTAPVSVPDVVSNLTSSC